MTAPAGHDGFTSKESDESERLHNQWVSEVIDSYGPDWILTKSINISDVLATKGMVNEFALLKEDKSQTWNSDGGFIWYKGKLVGCGENKYQKARENACERANRYLTFIPAKGIFISCAGPGFEKRFGGGSTGPMMQMLRFAGATISYQTTSPKNPDEIKFKNEFCKMLDNLV